MKTQSKIMAFGLATVAALLASCRSTPMPPDRAGPAPAPAPAPEVQTGGAVISSNARVASPARTIDAYKKDFAQALYAAHRERVFSGILPPLLYGVTVVEINLDANGTVLSINPMRVPSQATETLGVVRQLIGSTKVPVPQLLGASGYRNGRITFNETFLFTKELRFQVHTLSEGQARE